MAVFQPLECLSKPRECGLKLLEEASEACEALKAVEKAQGSLQACDAAGMTRADYARRDALSELCDVLQTVCNCLHALDVDFDALELAALGVRESNRDRGRAEVRDAASFAFFLLDTDEDGADD